jgi:ribulose kinase
MPRSAISAAKTCTWLLIETPGNQSEIKLPKSWESANKIWAGHRRGNRAERYTLYVRTDVTPIQP